ncbi:MAG TPA: OsmC family protein [Ktedonobacteraceae bacterium]|jgi:uncharacterized OsmC-like protein|nr:OsmC family protein [Ktedonobacteraceae bacterium]
MEKPVARVARVRLLSRDGYHLAYLGDADIPIVYGTDTNQVYAPNSSMGLPVAPALDHLVAALAACMYGTLAGALLGRSVPYEQASFLATAEGYIVPIGHVQRVQSVAIAYTLAVPDAWQEATMRALKVHARGCPVHQTLSASIAITWSATLQVGNEHIMLHQEAH